MKEFDINEMTQNQRLKTDIALGITTNELFGVIGPCGPRFADFQQLDDEGHDIQLVHSTITDLVLSQRLPIWKPRSNPERDWNGEETTNALGALELVSHRSRMTGNCSIEIGKTEHIGKYGHLLSFAWLGARNNGNTELLKHLVESDPTLPIGVKNGLNGEIDDTLEQIEKMRLVRGIGSATIVLLFRGGINAQNPDDWEKQYLRALELTDGKMIVDVAHGGEMAHSPQQDFTKSAMGQVACFKHVISMAEEGHVPAGIMMESSNVRSVTDPHIPFQTGVDLLLELRLAMLKSRKLTQTNV